MAEKNRILYATSGTAPGYRREGLQAEQAARALAPWYDLDILCPMLGRRGHVMEFHGARLMRVPLPDEGVEGAGALGRAMARQLGDGVYDTVHVRTPIEGEAALHFRDEHGYTLIYEPSPPSQLMGFLGTPDGKLHVDRLRGVERRLVETCDVLIVHGVRAQARARGLRAADRTVVSIAPGVDVDRFCRLPLRPEGPAEVLILETPHSGLGDVRGVGARLLDQPWGPAKWRPEDARDLAIAMNTAAACLALPPPAWDAWFDSMPFGVLEAAACLRPVIAPRLPGVVEVLGEAGEHLLYDPSVPAEAVRILHGVISQPGAYGPVVESIGARIRSSFSSAAMRARLLMLYAGLVDPAGDPPAVPVDTMGG